MYLCGRAVLLKRGVGGILKTLDQAGQFIGLYYYVIDHLQGRAS